MKVRIKMEFETCPKCKSKMVLVQKYSIREVWHCNQCGNLKMGFRIEGVLQDRPPEPIIPQYKDIRLEEEKIEVNGNNLKLGTNLDEMNLLAIKQVLIAWEKELCINCNKKADFTNGICRNCNSDIEDSDYLNRIREILGDK